jgi:hypothetical protein
MFSASAAASAAMTAAAGPIFGLPQTQSQSDPRTTPLHTSSAVAFGLTPEERKRIEAQEDLEERMQLQQKGTETSDEEGKSESSPTTKQLFSSIDNAHKSMEDDIRTGGELVAGLSLDDTVMGDSSQVNKRTNEEAKETDKPPPKYTLNRRRSERTIVKKKRGSTTK